MESRHLDGSRPSARGPAGLGGHRHRLVVGVQHLELEGVLLTCFFRFVCGGLPFRRRTEGISSAEVSSTTGLAMFLHVGLRTRMPFLVLVSFIVCSFRLVG